MDRTRLPPAKPMVKLTAKIGKYPDPFRSSSFYLFLLPTGNRLSIKKYHMVDRNEEETQKLVIRKPQKF